MKAVSDLKHPSDYRVLKVSSSAAGQEKRQMNTKYSGGSSTQVWMIRLRAEAPSFAIKVRETVQLEV